MMAHSLNKGKKTKQKKTQMQMQIVFFKQMESQENQQIKADTNSNSLQSQVPHNLKKNTV